jgi:hypothetical protein
MAIDTVFKRISELKNRAEDLISIQTNDMKRLKI